MGNLRSRYSLILLSSCICVLVTVYPIISYVTIGLYCGYKTGKKYIPEFGSRTKIEVLVSDSTTLADLPAREIVFTNVGLKTMQVWTIKDDRIFTITYEADEEDFQNYLQVTQRMTESFQIIE